MILGIFFIPGYFSYSGIAREVLYGDIFNSVIFLILYGKK